MSGPPRCVHVRSGQTGRAPGNGIARGRRDDRPEKPPASLSQAARKACRRGAELSPRAPRGAALLTRAGNIYSGCDLAAPQETGLALCAERAAVIQAIMAGEKRYLALVLRAGHDGTEDSGIPCGACLQVLAEFSPAVRIFWGTGVRPRGGLRARELLPGAFRLRLPAPDSVPSARSLASSAPKSSRATSKSPPAVARRK